MRYASLATALSGHEAHGVRLQADANGASAANTSAGRSRFIGGLAGQ